VRGVDGPSAIAVIELRKTFGDVEAVRGVSFEVGGGEVFGFLGPNGAGKTTTINILCTWPAPPAGAPESPDSTSPPSVTTSAATSASSSRTRPSTGT
jgi:ABC-type branched-subunit amino acid transport system ATPase component